MVNTKTKLFSIIGYPVKHSFSPQMQNAWFADEKLNCAYLSFKVDPKNLKKVIDAFKILGFYGINVTIPHKTTVMKYLDSADKAAKAIGGVNTISIKNGKLYGYNTDHSGFSADLLSKKIILKNKKILVYGAGGGSRAVIYALKHSGTQKIYIANRTKSKAQKLAKHFKIESIDTSKIKELLPEIDILVNTSSCGMKRTDSLPFKVNNLKNDMIIYDLIYNKKTPFTKLAKEKKLRYFSGEGMLINQGAHGFKIWTGMYPDTKKALRLFKKFTR